MKLKNDTKGNQKIFLIIGIVCILIFSLVLMLQLFLSKRDNQTRAQEMQKEIKEQVATSSSGALELPQRTLPQDEKNQSKDSVATPKIDPNDPGEASNNQDSIYYYRIPQGHGEGASINFKEYGRGLKQYTKADTSRTLQIDMPNIDDVAAYIPDQYLRINFWLCGYAKSKGIQPTKATILGYVFDQDDGTRLQIYFEFNDPANTLATVLFQERTPTKGAHIDVLPCQWTKQELENRVYEGKEIQ